VMIGERRWSTKKKQRTCNQGAETRSCIVGHPKIV
jgi:hypothetical protein